MKKYFFLPILSLMLFNPTFSVFAATDELIDSITTDIVFDTYTNSDYGFSIKYPQNWYIDGEVYESEPTEYDDGSVSIVTFNENPDLSGRYVVVTLFKNDTYARDYEDQEYLHQMQLMQKSTCVDYDVEIGYKCVDHSLIDSKIFSIDGHKAYQITEKFTETQKNEKPSQNIGILTDIIYGNNIWSIYSYNTESEYPKVTSEIEEIVNSFDLDETIREDFNKSDDIVKQESVSNQELKDIWHNLQVLNEWKIPEWISSLFIWYDEGRISGGEIMDALQFLIKEEIIKI